MMQELNTCDLKGAAVDETFNEIANEASGTLEEIIGEEEDSDLAAHPAGNGVMEDAGPVKSQAAMEKVLNNGWSFFPGCFRWRLASQWDWRTKKLR